jgi:uncharacterized membrane protein
MPVQEFTETPSSTDPHSAPSGERRNLSQEVQTKLARQSPGDGPARFLGWFSIGLGVTEFVFPRTLARIIGTPSRPMTTRLMGLREIGVGVGILASPRPAGWIKARVAGDMLDLALLKSSFGSRKANPARLGLTTAAVSAVAVADILYAQKYDSAESVPNRIRIEASMAVNRSPEECYSFWRRIENFPQFMEHLCAVQITGEKTSHWKLKLNAMKTLEWDSEITRDEAGNVIEWRSLGGGDLQNFGSVQFQPRLSGPGTTVRLAMEYAPPAAGTGAMGGQILKMISEYGVREDLRRFKSVIETGEVPTTNGQPVGGKGEEIR